MMHEQKDSYYQVSSVQHHTSPSLWRTAEVRRQKVWLLVSNVNRTVSDWQLTSQCSGIGFTVSAISTGQTGTQEMTTSKQRWALVSCKDLSFNLICFAIISCLAHKCLGQRAYK